MLRISFRDLVIKFLNAISCALPLYGQLSNHGQRRLATRKGSRYTDALNILLLTLPGTCTTYQGEEIGQQDIHVTFEDTKDPWGKLHGEVHHNYDPPPPPPGCVCLGCMWTTKVLPIIRNLFLKHQEFLVTFSIRFREIKHGFRGEIRGSLKTYSNPSDRIFLSSKDFSKSWIGGAVLLAL